MWVHGEGGGGSSRPWVPQRRPPWSGAGGTPSQEPSRTVAAGPPRAHQVGACCLPTHWEPREAGDGVQGGVVALES